ncbi:hypothetical protein [Escherichia coli]|uniref:hypothetical protein n=1 Tax=Escherichia coli TaxID=562 RepID=UPI0039A0A449
MSLVPAFVHLTAESRQFDAWQFPTLAWGDPKLTAKNADISGSVNSPVGVHRRRVR